MEIPSVNFYTFMSDLTGSNCESKAIEADSQMRSNESDSSLQLVFA
jgi:hypothetical protein